MFYYSCENIGQILVGSSLYFVLRIYIIKYEFFGEGKDRDEILKGSRIEVKKKFFLELRRQ